MKYLYTHSRYTGSAGLSTLEVLIAIALTVLSVTSVIVLVFSGQATATDTELSHQGVYLAQQGLEKERAGARSYFGNLVVGTVVDNSDPTYSKTITITQGVDPYTRHVSSQVTWPGMKGLPVALATTITDWASAPNGLDCYVPPGADWSVPTVVNTTEVDIGAGNTATGIMKKGNYVYITSAGSNGSKVFSVVDVTDPSNPNPTPVASLTTANFPAGVSADIFELDAVFVSGDYAYVMGYDHNSSFNDQGGTVFVKDNFAYVGTVKSKDEYDEVDPTRAKLSHFAVIDISDPENGISVKSNLLLPGGNEMFVIDISNASLPSVKWPIKNVSKQINLIQVYNQKAYVSVEDFDNSATGALLPDGTHLPPGAGFMVFDVSNVSTSPPRLIGYFVSDGHGYGMFTKKPSEILLGSGGNGRLYSLDSSLLPISEIDQASPLGHRISGIVASGKYAFIGAQNPGRSFMVIDISNLADLSYPPAVGFLDLSSGGVSKGVPAGGLDCQGSLFYLVTDDHADTLKIIGPKPPYSPTIVTALSPSTIGLGGSAKDTAVLNGASATAGGTVTYKAYTNSACIAGAQSAGTKTVTNATVPDSDSITFNTAGTYYWQAVYSGDINNNGVTSLCTAGALTVNKVDPTVTSEIHNDAHGVVTTVSAGTKVHAKAIVTGAGPTPTGKVDFRRYANDTCSPPVADTDGNKTLAAGSFDQTRKFTTVAGQKVSYQVRYQGDTNYNAKDGPCVPLTVH